MCEPGSKYNNSISVILSTAFRVRVVFSVILTNLGRIKISCKQIRGRENAFAIAGTQKNHRHATSNLEKRERSEAQIGKNKKD